MAAREDQLLGDRGKTDSPAIVPKMVPRGRSWKKLERLDQPASVGCEKPEQTPKPQIAEKNPDERTGRHWQPVVIEADAKKVDPIIAEYEKADFNRRMQMYLQMPQLGSEFDSINRNGPQTDLSSEFNLRGRSFAAQMGMALGSGMACRGLGK